MLPETGVIITEPEASLLQITLLTTEVMLIGVAGTTTAEVLVLLQPTASVMYAV
jgi:hypothetical protein